MDKLARKIGVTNGSIWQWENKKTSELKEKQINLLKKYFSDDEVDSLFNPGKYFAPDGTPIIEMKTKEAQEPDETDNDVYIQETNQEDTFYEKEIITVLRLLTDNNKQNLVQYADYLYHQEQGMKLPHVCRK